MIDFNAQPSNWCNYDSFNNEEVRIDSVTLAHGLEQLICEPTHMLSISSSCIDLVLISQPT